MPTRQSPIVSDIEVFSIHYPLGFTVFIWDYEPKSLASEKVTYGGIGMDF